MLIDICEPGQSPCPADDGAVVGIDLGTTNSLVAISNNNIQEVIANDDGNFLLPSIVAYDDNGDNHNDNNGNVIVGSGASKYKNAVYSIKRLMGKNIDEAQEISGESSFEILDSSKDVTAQNNGDVPTLNINNFKKTPVEISAEILKSLKYSAEKELGNNVDKAVITVPAYFDEAARLATKNAAELAGIKVLRLINEPTAAALAYGLDNQAEGKYIIYDLGGGTFDVSLLKMEKGVFQVLATAGDTSLGGDDFDNAIAQYFIQQPISSASGNSDISNNTNLSSYSNQDIATILSYAKQAKEHLTNNEQGNWSIKLSNQTIECSINVTKFNEIIGHIVDKTIAIIGKVLIDSHIKRDDIKGVVMVGGSTRIPLVKQTVDDFMGSSSLTNLDPDKVVAIGAAIQAETLAKGSGSLLLDVTPLSLGLETMGGLVEVIIPRNTPIPTSAKQKFTTFKDGQNAIKIHIVQGEREMVFQCRSLAKFTLRDIPPMIAGAAIIEVTFNIDADGLLRVSAIQEDTNNTQNIEVKPSYGLPAQRIEEMLRDSMVNARADITERLLAESKVEAQLMLQNIESALQKDGNLLDKEQLEIINEQINLVKKLCTENNRDELDYQVQQLDAKCANFAEMRMNNSVGAYLSGKEINNV